MHNGERKKEKKEGAESRRSKQPSPYHETE